jgi:hypothetical protein
MQMFRRFWPIDTAMFDQSTLLGLKSSHWISQSCKPILWAIVNRNAIVCYENVEILAKSGLKEVYFDRGYVSPECPHDM